MSSLLDPLESARCWSHNRTQEPLMSDAGRRNLPVSGVGVPDIA